MTTKEAIQILLPLLSDEVLICTTGYVSRDVCAIKDRPQNFYMIGSMGLAPAIGLGIASASPGKKVVIFDGDGALLMGLGILPMIGTLKPKQFLHVVFDNETYASTGHQPTYSRQIALEKLALECGYAPVEKVTTPQSLQKIANSLLTTHGTRFLLIKCADDSKVLHGKKSASPRIPYPPEEITHRLRQILAIS